MARMPSSRNRPSLNPRLASLPPAHAQDDAEPDEREKAARAGGFHESSFDLAHGLEVSVSEWPEEVTIPGALGER